MKNAMDDDNISELGFDEDYAQPTSRPINTKGTLNPPPIKFGWLKKQADHMKTWRQRFVVLHNGYLLYYTKEIKELSTGGKQSSKKTLSKQVAPRGIICLAGIREKSLYEAYSSAGNPETKNSIENSPDVRARKRASNAHESANIAGKFKTIIILKQIIHHFLNR